MADKGGKCLDLRIKTDNGGRRRRLRRGGERWVRDKNDYFF